MNTDFFFQSILDTAEDEGIKLTQAQVDIIQQYCSQLNQALEAAE